jgi:hypothetical protein
MRYLVDGTRHDGVPGAVFLPVLRPFSAAYVGVFVASKLLLVQFDISLNS